MKKGVDLIYKFNGNIENGIDVFELSPILLSFGKLINEAHKTLFPEEPEIAINIKPFEKGSFEISIWMFAKDVMQRILNYITSRHWKKYKRCFNFYRLNRSDIWGKSNTNNFHFLETAN